MTHFARKGGAARRGKSAAGKDKAAHQHMFAVEALEPRLLLSADLNVAAGAAIVSGLQALNSAFHNLANSTALSGNAPFISRNLADLAGLASTLGPGVVDEIGLVAKAASAYFAGTSASSPPTLNGLASALDAIAVAGATGVTATATPTLGANGGAVNEITLALTVAEARRRRARRSAPPARAPAETLTGSYQLTQATAETLNLVFGADMTSPTAPVFDLMSATAAANTTFSAANLRQDPYLTATATPAEASSGARLTPSAARN